MSGDVTVQVDALAALIHEMVRLGGSEEEECRIVSEHLVGANLAGHDSHGIGIVATYINNLQRGLLVPNTPADCVHDDGPFLQFDGHKGYGQRVAEEVTEAAIARAQDSGSLCRHAQELTPYRPGGDICRDGGCGRVCVHPLHQRDRSLRPWSRPLVGPKPGFGTNPVTMAMPTPQPGRADHP